MRFYNLSAEFFKCFVNVSSSLTIEQNFRKINHCSVFVLCCLLSLRAQRGGKCKTNKDQFILQLVCLFIKNCVNCISTRKGELTQLT